RVVAVEEQQQPVERVVVAGHRLLGQAVPELKLLVGIVSAQLPRQWPLDPRRLAPGSEREQAEENQSERKRNGSARTQRSPPRTRTVWGRRSQKRCPAGRTRRSARPASRRWSPAS